MHVLVAGLESPFTPDPVMYHDVALSKKILVDGHLRYCKFFIFKIITLNINNAPIKA